MNRPHIIFLPYKLHFRYLLFSLAKKNDVTVLLPPEKELPEDSDLNGIRIRYWQFGIGWIKRVVGREIRTQKYVAGLSTILDGQTFNTLISCEFYHWYTLQCLSYKKKNPHIQLIVVSETKRWPQNPVAHIVKRMVFWYFKQNRKHIDVMLVYTQQAYDFLSVNMPDMEIVLVPTPIDTDLFTPQPGRTFLRDDTLRLLFNARYSPYKRHEDLFIAVARLQEMGRKIQLTCISRDNKRLDQVEALVRQHGVQNIVDFISAMPLSDIPELYHRHDVLILPSYNEAIGLVVPEAMACGLPTVTSDTVGGNVYVKEGVTGFIFKTGDIDSLVQTLESCFDADRLAQMGHLGREHIVANYTADRVVQKLENKINNTL